MKINHAFHDHLLTDINPSKIINIDETGNVSSELHISVWISPYEAE